MNRVSISAAWDETTAVLRREGRLLAPIALAFLVLPTTLLGTYSPETLAGAMPTEPVVSLLMLLMMLIGLVGRVAVARVAIGPASTVGDAITQALGRAFSAAGAFVIFLIPLALAMSPFLLQVRDPADPPRGAVLVILAIAIVALVLAIRLLSLVIPAAAADRGGPIALLQRSWQLTAGSWWRLLGFVILFYIAAAVSGWAARAVVGLLVTSAGGAAEPMSLSALIMAATAAVAAAIFSVVFIVMLARIYTQLAGRGEVQASVPGSAD